MISCSGFSQTLTPIVQELNGDTLFCFTIAQSKEIAKYIQAKLGCDSMMVAQTELVELYNQSIEINDSIANHLEQKIRNMEQLYKNGQTSMDLLNKTITIQDRKIKRSKAHKVLLGVGLGVTTVLLIKN